VVSGDDHHVGEKDLDHACDAAAVAYQVIREAAQGDSGVCQSHHLLPDGALRDGFPANKALSSYRLIQRRAGRSPSGASPQSMVMSPSESSKVEATTRMLSAP
jgi:hypothetical protein